MTVRPITDSPRPLKTPKLEIEGPCAYFPAELLLSIFCKREIASFRSLSNVKHLAYIPQVCRRWNQLIPDVILNLLNSNTIQAYEIPFLFKTSLYQPAKHREHTLLFFKYLFQEISREKLYQTVCERMDEDGVIETYMQGRLTHLNTHDIRYIEDSELDKLKGFYESIISINMNIYCAREPSFLMKFKSLNTLKLPVGMYDESFYKNMTQIQKLTMTWSMRHQDTHASLPLHYCTSLRSLKLECAYLKPLKLNPKYPFPHFLKKISIKNLEVPSGMFDQCYALEKLQLKFVILQEPIPIQNLTNLKHVSIDHHPQPKESTVTKAIAI